MALLYWPWQTMITGIGQREDNFLAMRSFIEENLPLFNQYYHITFDNWNQGILYLSKIEPQVELYRKQHKRKHKQGDDSFTGESKRIKWGDS